MRLVFEISHLRTATPATVSRAGTPRFALGKVFKDSYLESFSVFTPFSFRFLRFSVSVYTLTLIHRSLEISSSISHYCFVHISIFTHPPTRLQELLSHFTLLFHFTSIYNLTFATSIIAVGQAFFFFFFLRRSTIGTFICIFHIPGSFFRHPVH